MNVPPLIRVACRSENIRRKLIPGCARHRNGFSMVEVALALGVIAFALLSVVALLPIGVKSNQVSADETRAAGILTLLETDLRNTHPQAGAGAASGKSLLFHLPLPYALDGSQNRILANPPTHTLASGNSTDLLENETIAPSPSSNPPPRYQASVVYIRSLPNSLTPLEARLIVNWPPVNLNDPALASEEKKIAALTDTSKISGYVEAYVTFPAP